MATTGEKDGRGFLIPGKQLASLIDTLFELGSVPLATDRAHRIGQNKQMFVHRLIVDGTVEAKMLELHARKRSLVDQLLENRTTDRILLDLEALGELMGEV